MDVAYEVHIRRDYTYDPILMKFGLSALSAYPQNSIHFNLFILKILLPLPRNLQLD